MKNNKYFYIYNLHKANYLLQNGVPLLEIGTGRTDGVFFKFLKTDTSKDVLYKYKEINGFDD